MTEQEILRVRDLTEAGQVQYANYLLPYTGAGSGVRRALEYDPDAIFSNGVDQREITHSANEFVITIPRRTDQVTDQAPQKTDPAQVKADQVSNQALPKSDINTTQVEDSSNQPHNKGNQASSKSNQAKDSLVTRPLTKKEQDIRNFCSVPRTAQEIMNRLGITNQSKNRQKHITPLLELGVLERTIPDKPNDPNQKYRRKQ